MLDFLLRRKQPVDHWGARAFEYINYVSKAVEKINDCLHKELNNKHYTLITANIFWSVINDPGMVDAFYNAVCNSDDPKVRLVFSVQQDHTRVVEQVRVFLTKHSEKMGFRTLLKSLITPRKIVPTLDSRNVILVLHSKHLSTAKLVAEDVGDCAIVIFFTSDDNAENIIQASASQIRIEPNIKDTHIPINCQRQYSFAYQLIKKNNIKKLYTIEGASPLDLSSVVAANALNCETIAIQYGMPPVMHAGYYNLPYSRFVLWGSGFADQFKRLMPRSQLEYKHYTSLTTRSIEIKKRFNHHCVIAIQGPVGFINPTAWDEFMELFQKLSEQPVDVWVKYHPSIPADIPEYDNFQFFRGDGSVTNYLMQQAHSMIGIYSTTLIEAPLMNCVPIVFNPTSVPKIYPQLEQYGVGYHTTTVDECIAVLSHLQSMTELERNSDKQLVYCQDFFSKSAQSSA